MALGRKTGGRKKGTPNKATAERAAAVAAAAAAIGEAIPDAFAGDAHALLMAVYKNPALPIELRADAAKAAVRFEKPALASTVLAHRSPWDELTINDLRLLLGYAKASREAGRWIRPDTDTKLPGTEA
jgi:hypothetical protein